MGIAVAAMAPPVAIAMLSAKSIHVASAMYFLFMMISNLAIGPAAVSVNELVPPKLRGTASALYLLSVAFIGQALGPYAVVVMSDVFSSAGASGADALRSSLVILLSGYGLGLVFLILAGRAIGKTQVATLRAAK